MTLDPKPAVLFISRSLASDIDAVSTWKYIPIQQNEAPRYLRFKVPKTLSSRPHISTAKKCKVVVPDVMAPAALDAL